MPNQNLGRARLLRRITELEEQVEFLRRNPNYGTLTRQGFELEARRLTGQRFVVMIDIDHLHELNARFGSQEPVNEMIRRAFAFRDDDLLIAGNWASGDEVAFVVRSDPEQFSARLAASLGAQGISATMAWEPVVDDDVLGSCERALGRVYALKAQRGVSRC